jgi:amino acid transporter
MASYLQLKRFLLGDPLPSSAHSEERLSNAAGLAVLSSDALSSVAYATEEILVVLVLAGSGALSISMPIAGAIILLLAIIILSYRQTIRAYPNGGGAYIVARDGFLPRQLSLLGDRLVFSNGVILLSLCAIVLVVLFRGDTTAIIPLYAVGVFTSFTLSQTGMVRYWSLD